MVSQENLREHPRMQRKMMGKHIIDLKHFNPRDICVHSGTAVEAVLGAVDWLA